MAHPSRAEASRLVRAHGGRLGHRWGEPENMLGDRYCVDCGAMMRMVAVDDGRIAYWPAGAGEFAVGTNARLPCTCTTTEEAER